MTAFKLNIPENPFCDTTAFSSDFHFPNQPSIPAAVCQNVRMSHQIQIKF